MFGLHCMQFEYVTSLLDFLNMCENNMLSMLQFSAKKQEMRQDGYAQKDLEDSFAYLYLDGWHKVLI